MLLTLSSMRYCAGSATADMRMRTSAGPTTAWLDAHSMILTELPPAPHCRRSLDEQAAACDAAEAAVRALRMELAELWAGVDQARSAPQ